MASARSAFTTIALVISAALGCAEQQHPTAVHVRGGVRPHSGDGVDEGEIFGDVLGAGGGQLANVWVKLVPSVTALSQPSLLHLPFDSLEWADTGTFRNFMFDWSDPANSHNTCGTLTNYNANGTRPNEVHRPGPNQPPPTRDERHCVRPGTYTLSFSNNSNGSSPFWSQQVDYLQLSGSSVTNGTAGVTEYVEAPTYAEASPYLTDLSVDYRTQRRPRIGTP